MGAGWSSETLVPYCIYTISTQKATTSIVIASETQNLAFYEEVLRDIK
jgi:hypothetical protein